MKKTFLLTLFGTYAFLGTVAFAQAAPTSATWHYYGPIDGAVRASITALGDEHQGTLPVPVAGVPTAELVDTWGVARDAGRTHEGIDIFAPRGTAVVSPVRSVVTRMGYNAAPGTFVYAAMSGTELLYFAHLDSINGALKVGDTIEPGDVIGYVGNTGNASGASPHLHFTIYAPDGALNPYDRLMKGGTAVLPKEKEASKVLAEQVSESPEATVPDATARPAAAVPVAKQPPVFARTLVVGMRGEDVRALQLLLIKANSGAKAAALAKNGATTYFGPLTKAAVAEYQAKNKIVPAVGTFGPLTRARITAS